MRARGVGWLLRFLDVADLRALAVQKAPPGLVEKWRTADPADCPALLATMRGLSKQDASGAADGEGVHDLRLTNTRGTG